MTHLIPLPNVPGAPDDPRTFTRLTHEVRQAVLSGRTPRRAPRSIVGASWRRMKAQDLDPGGAPQIAPLPGAELLQRREASGLRPLLPLLRTHLLPTCEATGQLMVVADVQGRVLWREGTRSVLRHADSLGFVGGSAWTEGNVGTNAIGTCLVTEEPVHIHAAEHYAESHTPWTCAAAPLRDPLTGRVIGVVDVSGPARTGHAGTVSIVTLAARLAELEIRAAHHDRLQELRAIAAPLLVRVGGRALVVAHDGTTAAATGLVAPDRVALPPAFAGGEVWLPTIGLLSAEAVPGGWLLRPSDTSMDGGPATSLELDLSLPDPLVTLVSAGGTWTHAPPPRHCEILLALAVHPAGRSASQLSEDLYADSTRTVTVRAEVSRLRRTLGAVIQHRPYRIARDVQVTVVRPSNPTDALAGSSAPVVARWRTADITPA